MMRLQPLGVRPAIDDGQCASFQLCNIVREAPSVPAGQDGPAAAEGRGGNKGGAGLVQWPDRADDQYQVGIAPAYRDYRRARAGVGVFGEAQLGMACHKRGVAVGKGGQRRRISQRRWQGAQRGRGGHADLAARRPSLRRCIPGRDRRQQEQGQQQGRGEAQAVAPAHSASS
ncbi:hypothetical protein G6F22_010310 [Rhizopus arrhizus]|nr:hypothetical protein G6F22_010310 [Rhizopus arrhizus]